MLCLESVATLALFATILIATVRAAAKPEDSSYVAAVVEFRMTKNGATPAAQLRDRVDQYVSLMTKAAGQNVDIIVFPESTLTDHGQGLMVPDAADRVNPCDNSTYPNDGLLSRLSCAARAAKSYAVINLKMTRKCNAEVNGAPCTGQDSVYNTNVVFDRNGMVISM